MLTAANEIDFSDRSDPCSTCKHAARGLPSSLPPSYPQHFRFRVHTTLLSCSDLMLVLTHAEIEEYHSSSRDSLDRYKQGKSIRAPVEDASTVQSKLSNIRAYFKRTPTDRMADTTSKKPKSWTDEEKASTRTQHFNVVTNLEQLEVLASIVANQVEKIDYTQIKVPEGRTERAMKDTIRDVLKQYKKEGMSIHYFSHDAYMIPISRSLTYRQEDRRQHG